MFTFITSIFRAAFGLLKALLAVVVSLAAICAGQTPD